MSKEPLVQVVGLDFAYREGEGWSRVLHDVNFTIFRGEAFGLVGESGCGKSTIAYQLLAYRRENSRIERGHILFNGMDLKDLDRRALDRLRGNRVALVPQNPTTALSPGMRVGRQLVEVMQFHDMYEAREAERTETLFRLVGLPDPAAIGRRYPHQLSGGQQQRVCIAMALACDPDLVVLDEPTTGLDVTTQEQIIDLLKDLRSRLRMSMLYVTHDLGVLAQIADRVGVMYAGHMVETASTRELFSSPRHPYTRGLIASVPQIERTSRRSDIVLRGLLKREELPVGCPFQPRCDFAEARCEQQVQVLEQIAPDHEVACRRSGEIALHEPRPAALSEGATRVIHPEPILSVEEIDLGYGGRDWWPWSPTPNDVVKDLSFVIKEGETFALVGESGSGKSTIARAVAGLLAPKQGRIRFEGLALPGLVARRSRELRRRIQYIFQNPDASLNPRARIGAILSRPFEFFFAPDRTTTKRKVTEALEGVRLDRSYASRYPDQLSGGERQRVAIARALIAESKLLLCDEILSGLDVSVQANVLSLLQRLRREHNLSMLFISHDLAVVRSLADRVGVLFRGQLMEIGDVEDIFRPPFHPYTYQLLMAVPSIRRLRQTRVRPRENSVVAGHRGCAFAGRCQWQLGALCEREAPPWREVASRHRIRCHISISELATHAQEDLLHLAMPAAAAHQ